MWRRNMEEKNVTSARGKTVYKISRNKNKAAETIVFLHGLTANYHLFDLQTDYFSQEYNVMAWDAPCHGKSRPYHEFTYPNITEELKAILDKEDIERAVLVGQSMGGFVAQSFIIKYPDMVRGFVAIDTCPYGSEYYSKSDFFWLRQVGWISYLFPDKILRKVMAEQCGFTQYAREHMMKMLEDYSKKELCRLMDIGFGEFIPQVNDSKINCPVCLVVGEHDNLGKVRKYNRQWHKKEGYPLHFIENAAHNANEDNPEAVNRIIEDFLARLE